MLTLLRDLRRLRRTIDLPQPGRGRSLAIRHVDAGSCNGCEHELTQLASPYYDLQRFGLGIVAGGGEEGEGRHRTPSQRRCFA